MADKNHNLFFKLVLIFVGIVALTSAGYAIAYTGPGALTAGSGSGLMTVSGSNIGIGSASPILPLQVKDNAVSYPFQAVQFTTTDWTTTVGSTLQIGHGASTGNTFSELRALTSGWNAWGNLIMQVGGGRVGIGTSTPAYTLDVNGTARATAFVGAVSGSIAADNVSSGSFGSLQGGGTYTFPASLSVGTTTLPSVKLDVFGTGAFGNMTTSRGTWSNGLSVQNLAATPTSLFLWQSGVGSGHIGFRANDSNLYIVNSYADGLITNPAAIALNSSGFVGIGIAAPSDKLDVEGSIVNNGLKIGNSGGSYLRLYDDGNPHIEGYSGPLWINQVGGQNTILNYGNSTNVGIGNATPAYKLDVAGDINYTGTLRQNGTPVSGGSGQWTTSSTSIYYNTGNVGIGTSAPSQKLEVSGNAKATAFIGTLSGSVAADNVSSGSFGSLQGGGTYTFPASLFLGGNGTGDLLTINTSNTGSTSGGLLIQSSSAGSAYFRYDRQGSWAGKTYIGNNAATASNAPTTAITIDGTSGANLVGIGTTAPAYKLDVTGNIQASGEIIGTGATGSGQFRAIGGNYGAFIRNDGVSTYLPLLTASANQYGSWNGLRPFRVDNASGDLYFANAQVYMSHATGNVGIGTTNPRTPLHVKVGTDQNFTVRSLGGVTQLEAVNDAYTADVPLRIDASQYQIMGGNVGIGTASPAQKLDVNGTVALYGKVAFEGADSWLRINQSATFSSGTYFGSNTVRTDGQLQVGPSGSSFLVTSGGNVTASGYVTAGGYVSDITGRVARNLLDTNTWTVSTGSTGNWSANGDSAAENQRLWNNDPFGNPALLWRGVTDAVNDSSGGWNYYNIPVTDTKAYREAVWFRMNAGAGGNLYLGLDSGNTNNLDGTANANPYFHAINWGNFIAGRWYLFVGYIHASNDPSTTSYSAVYDGVTGQKVFTGTDYKNKVGITVQAQRAYSYYNTTAGTTVDMWGPRFEQMDGSEPSIGALLGGTGPTSNLMYANTCTGAVTIDWSRGSTQHCTMIGAVTFTFTNGVSGGNYRLILLQDATGGRTASWPASVRWGSMGVPALTATPSKTDYVGFIYNNVSGAYDGIAFNSNF